jgi:UDP:flavonoid glycosyltransferase YjiC (YdhE family)
MMKSFDFMIRDILLPSLPGSCEALMEAADGASLVVGNFLALAAPIVAEKFGVPFIPAHIQPMVFLSAADPPTGVQLRMLVPSPRTALFRLWNRAWIGLIRHHLRRRYAPEVDRVRRAYGLPPLTRSPLFDGERPAPLVLGLYSTVIGKHQDDLPANTHLVGFPALDGECGWLGPADEALLRFLDAGPPPVVFTLGSLAGLAAGDFFPESVKAAQRLKRRAVLLTGHAPAAPVGDGTVHVCRHTPHAAIFPRAAAVVHHGGVGTVAQALRAGVPQLVVPHLGDQWDNGARVARLGVGRTIRARRYTARRAARLLAGLLSDPAVAERAGRVARLVRAEDGARAGADLIDAWLATTRRGGAVGVATAR